MTKKKISISIRITIVITHHHFPQPSLPKLILANLTRSRQSGIQWKDVRYRTGEAVVLTALLGRSRSYDEIHGYVR